MIQNPCDRSIVNEDGALAIEALTVPEGEELLELIYLGPTDSTSVTYGNGYDKCGKLRYSYFDLNEVIFSLPDFSSIETKNEN